MATQDNGIGLAWFLVGAAVGASVALLYAPQSGRDTRRFIVKKSLHGKEALTDSSKEMLDRGRELFDKARAVADEAAEAFEHAVKLVNG